jgi:hypothetical protein
MHELEQKEEPSVEFLLLREGGGTRELLSF